MDSMAGCQYRMTSYEERVNSSDMDPSYGIHMHDPRVIEYMGAPESARLMGRTPEYWLQHMGREQTIQAALRLHHDASLIMTNIQIMSQLATSFSEVIGSDADGTRQRAVPNRIGGFGDSGSPGPTGSALYGSYGAVETNERPSISGSSVGIVQ